MGLLPDFGNLLYTVGAFVLALSVIVAVHEYGHYIVGRWSGIRAEVFSLGFGPRLVSRVDRRGTRWQIALIPLGGYVKFLGDANAASAGADDAAMAGLSAEDRRHTMHGAPLWARAATVAAGPVFNFILSILIFAGMILWSGLPTERPVVGAVVALPGGSHDLRAGDEILAVADLPVADFAALGTVIADLPPGETLSWRVARDGVEIDLTGPQLYPARVAGVAAQSAAHAAGLRPGDVIVAADGAPMHRFADLQAAVRAAEGAALTLTVWTPEGAAGPGQGGTTRDVVLTPKVTDLPLPGGGFETDYKIGVVGSFVFEPQTRPASVTEAFGGAVAETWGVIVSSLSGLWHMITGAISSCNLRGAIGIAETSAAAAESGAGNFIWFIAVLSAAIGLLNLFPIPVLDGGHLLFHAWEAVAGKPPSDKVLNALTALGLAVVLTLMVFGLSNDLFCP